MTHPAALLKNSWHAYAHNFRKWLLLTLPLAAIAASTVTLSGLTPSALNSIKLSPIITVIGFVVLLAAIIVVVRAFSTAAILAAHRSLNGGSPNIKESYKFGFKTFWPVLWVTILRGLIVFGGLLLLVVPGVIWALRYSLATQVAIIEGKHGMDALRRSREITNGKLLETFINFGVISAIVGYGIWLTMLGVLALLVVLASLVSMLFPESAYNAIYVFVGILTICTEAVIIWFATPLTPLAFTSIYKDFSNK